jgi:sugar/nucleoside kinase (ribokinase family)
MTSNADIETGAGNSFLGGLAAGMLISGDIYQGWPSVICIGRIFSLNYLRLVSRLVCDRLGVFHH